MKCPFELPAEARLGQQFAEGFYRKIEDKNGNTICLVPDFENADYITRTINNHEKLLKIKQISYEALCTGDQGATDKAIDLIEDYEQTLFHKEAENK